MIIGCYTDLHLSETSSIFPLSCENSIYTTRLQMIIDTAEWMYSVFEKNNVNLIINGGDTLDTNTISSMESKALSEFYLHSRGTREIHLLGNHEMLDKGSKFYSNAILDNLDFIDVYNEPTIINNEISILPYMDHKYIDNNILSNISNKILFSHIDIKGSHLTLNYLADSGVDPELLSMYFNLVVNGHIHTYERLESSENEIYNIGSVSSNSFADSSNYIPSITIIDTEDLSIKRFFNPYAILFRKLRCNSVNDLLKSLDNLDNNYRHILRVSTNHNLRDDFRQILDTRDNIVTYRVVSDLSRITENTIASKDEIVNSNIVIEDEFKEFLNVSNLKYPMNEYLSILEEV